MLKFLIALFLTLGWLTAEHFPPWVSWHNEVWVFAAVLLWAIVGLASLRGKKIPTVVMPGIAWIGILAFSMVWVQYALGYIVYLGNAILITFYILVFVFALTAGRYATMPRAKFAPTISQHQSLDSLAEILLLGAVCSAGIALAQVLQVAEAASWITPMTYLRRPGGNLAQPNQLATLLLMGLASLLYLFELGRLRSTSSLLICFLLLCGIAVTESRTGLLGFLMMVAWWILRRRAVDFKVQPFAILSGSVALISLFWYWPQLHAFIFSFGLSADVSATVDTGASKRMFVWPQLVDAALQRPWFGWGLGEVSKAHNAVAHINSKSEPYTYAHNFILDLALGVGLPLTALLVAATGVWLWRRTQATQSLIPWYCFAMLLPFGVHSMLEFPFAYAYFLVPAAFALGFIEGTLNPKRVLHIPWATAVVVFAVASIAMAWTVKEYIQIQEDYVVARFEALHVGKTEIDYTRPKIYLLTQLDALLEVVRLRPTPGMKEERIALLRDATQHIPTTGVQNRYALALALNGYPDEAHTQLKIIRAMHGEPEYAGIRENWKALADSKYPQLRSVELP